MTDVTPRSSPGLIRCIRLVIRPGPPDARWAGISAAIILSTLAVIVVLAWLGAANPEVGVHGHFDELAPGTWLSFSLLIMAAIYAARIDRRLRPHPFARFWAVAFFALIYLAFDDLAKIHENIDWSIHWMLGWEDDGITEHLDDAIVALYGPAALIYGWRWRGDLVRMPWTVLSLAASSFCFAIMVFVDVGWDSKIMMMFEEGWKILAGALILCATVAAYVYADRGHSLDEATYDGRMSKRAGVD